MSCDADRCPWIHHEGVIGDPELIEVVEHLADVLVVIDHRVVMTAGCGRCRLLVDTEDPNVFTLASEWEAGAEAEPFFESREFQIFKSIRILLRQEPVVTMGEIRSRATRLIRSR
jgi:quinol monooxygenase YgiN